jgi:hypothetical protein
MTPMIVNCPNCQSYVETDCVGAYEYPIQDNKCSGRFVLLKCRRCYNPLLVNQDNIGNQAAGDIWDTPLRLYPTDETHANPNAPKGIRSAYDEAAACYKTRAYTAAAIMCRKTLEGICSEYGASQRNLVQSLEKMRENGIIDERLFDWSNALRLAGNEAAHDVGVTISKEDARDMLEFTNAILDYLFSFREKFEEFRKRRGIG